MFPNAVFDPYTGFAVGDSIRFRKATSIVRSGSMLVGLVIIFFGSVAKSMGKLS